MEFLFYILYKDKKESCIYIINTERKIKGKGIKENIILDKIERGNKSKMRMSLSRK